MDELLFSTKHMWVKKHGENYLLGLTDFLQQKLGAILFVNLPEPGDQISLGENFGDVESKKTVMEMESPISGEVVAVNEELLDDPSRINISPFESWLIEVKADQLSEVLMSEDSYNKHISRPWMENH